MQQLILPAAQQAVDNLQSLIQTTEAEIAGLKATIKDKRQLVKDWKQAVRAITGEKPAGKQVTHRQKAA
jgi:hypothetical protein